MPRNRLTALAVLVIAIGASLLACDLGMFAVSSKPMVVIVSPPSGSQFREGDDIPVQSTSTDMAGIVRVDLLVDGAVVRTDPSPNPQASFPLVQVWQAISGTHTLSVRAYNAANQPSDPAAIAITVAASEATATAMPTPAATGAVSTPDAIPTTGSISPTGTPVPGTCTNTTQFLLDVTIPDGSVMAPGQVFNKIWRMRNTGTCPWDSNYQFVFVSGEAMGNTIAIAVPGTAPGATVDLPIAMTAPAAAGAHIGQWRMRAPNGTIFGSTLSVSISVVAGATAVPATPTVTRTPFCSSVPVINAFTASPSTISSGGSTTLSWGTVDYADSAVITPGIGGVATPGNIVLSLTATTTYTLTATGCGGTTTRQLTVIVNPTSSVPGMPSLVAPAEGKVLRVTPRVATFSWNAVTFTGGVTYTIEIQKNTGTWVSHVTQGSIAGTSYNMPTFPGDNQGRWRVWARSPTAGEGAKSDWRTFGFNTGGAQYAGTWTNDDSNTGGITRLIISYSAPNLTVNPYGKCASGECNWGSKAQALAGEPVIIGAFPGDSVGHQLTITMNNDAGTSLRAVDSSPSATNTYTFHK